MHEYSETLAIICSAYENIIFVQVSSSFCILLFSSQVVMLCETGFNILRVEEQFLLVS